MVYVSFSSVFRIDALEMDLNMFNNNRLEPQLHRMCRHVVCC